MTAVPIKDYQWTPGYADAGEVTDRVRPREPAYLFNEGSLHNRARRFHCGFPGTVGYAVKANPEARVIKALAAGGVRHFDVASLGEIEVITAHQPDATLHFNNPVKAREDIETSYRRYGVRSFALDEDAELEKIRRATDDDRDVLYSVRFKLGHEGASYDFGSKFGCDPDRAVRLLQKISAFGARPALTFHPGSQCAEPRMYDRYLAAAARIAEAAGVPLTQINVGGGFPERYENTRVPELETYFDVIDRAVRRYFNKPPRLMCEPGRAMVAPSVSLLSCVIHVRDDGRTLFLNDGVYGGMQEQSLVDLRLPVKVWREGRQLGGCNVDYQAFGPTCDPVDRLSRKMTLPANIKAGDYVEFGLLGAYGSATSTSFNGFRSASYVNVHKGFHHL